MDQVIALSYIKLLGPIKNKSAASSSVDYNGRPSAIFRSKCRNGRSLFSIAGQNGHPTSVRREYQLQIVALLFVIHIVITVAYATL